MGFLQYFSRNATRIEQEDKTDEKQIDSEQETRKYRNNNKPIVKRNGYWREN